MKNRVAAARSGLREMFSNRNAVVMTTTVTLSHFSTNLLLPWWPLYMNKELGAPIPVVGVLFTVERLLMVLMMSPGGVLSDRYGRRRMILVGQVFRLLTPLLFLLAATWQQLIPGIVAHALSMLYQPSIYSATLESFSEKRRAVGFGVVQTVMLLVTSVTMPIGGALIDNLGLLASMKIILIAFAILEVAKLAIRFFFLSETLEVKRREAYSFRRSLLPSNLQLTKSVWAMLITQCLFFTGYSVSLPFVTLYATERMSLTTTQWGLIQMFFQVAFALFTLPGAMFASRFGNRLAITLSGMLSPVPLLGYLFLKDFNSVLVLNIIYSIGGGFGGVLLGGGPAWQDMLARLVPPERRGRVVGFMNTVAGIISSVSSTIGGFIWVIFAPETTLFCGAALEIVSVLVFYVFTREPATQAPKQS